MTDALAADRLRGESNVGMFAFVGADSANQVESKEAWKAKGVTPVLYRKTPKHHSSIEP